MHRAFALGALVALALISPSAASASVVGVKNGVVFLSAFPGEANNVEVSANGADLTLKDDVGVTVRDGCEEIAPDTARCSVARNFEISVALGDGNDRANLDSSLVAYASPLIDGG